MWTVHPDYARSQIGTNEVARLGALRRWLYPDAAGELSFRTAPSLVARSEVELFGISMPRFALRAYLTDRSFVNVRRIETFCRLAASWGEPPPSRCDYVDSSRMKRLSPAQIIRPGSCIGDSLLVPPDWLKGYHVLVTELGRAYGEHLEVEGTPFVSHVRLGGGMCAQGVCYMATALHQHTTRCICGVAEITALASDEDAPVLDLGGMTPQKMCHYFNHPKIGLSAALQTILVPDQDDATSIVRLCETLRAYALSDVPVIMLVDLGRMCGVECSKEGEQITTDLNDGHLFGDNDLSEELLAIVKRCRAAPKPKMRPHTVLVVGCQSERGDAEAESFKFVLNDPTTYPFMRVTSRQLAEARSYDKDRWDQAALGPIQFIPVTPQEVRLPLASVGKHDDSQPGLADIALQILTQGWPSDLPHFTWPTDPKAETRLVDLHWCKDPNQIDPRFHRRLAHLELNTRTRLAQLVQDRQIPGKWCWIHTGPADRVDGARVDSIWVWDATAPPPPDCRTPPDQLRSKYLLAVLTGENSEWNLVHTSPRALKPALITSFRTCAVPDIAQTWPRDPAPDVDLYAFMQAEVDQWLSNQGSLRRRRPDRNDAVAVMADCADNPQAIGNWADSVCTILRSDERPIVALTSFVPEVTSLQYGAYEMACDAVRFLVKFAVQLRRKGHRGLRTVELVAGSRMGGIWPAPEGRYMATQMDPDVACHRLLSILNRAMSDCAGYPSEERIAIGLEAEPGPLYSLRDWHSLRRLCREIAMDPHLSRFVGVNLDVAHWKLARNIRPDEVWDTPEVRDRIVHAHLAGHHPCSHFGDLPPFDLNEKEDFQPWIDLLRRIAADRRNPDLPQFSGYVSLELEAAKDGDLVALSVGQLLELI